MIKDFEPRLYQQTILGTTTSFNTLVVLPTGMGKCLSYNDPVFFVDGSLKKIGDIVEEELKKGKIISKTKEHIIIQPSHTHEVFSLDSSLQFEPTKIINMHKIKSKSQLFKITTMSGAEVTVTGEHPLLTLQQKLMWKKALRCGTEIARSAREFQDKRITNLHVFGIPGKYKASPGVRGS